MRLVYEPDYKQQNGLTIHEIIFCTHPACNDVTLFGSAPRCGNGTAADRDFGCEFSMLTDLLLQAGAEGMAVIDAIAGMLCEPAASPHEPVGLTLTELLGHALHLPHIQLKIYKPKEQAEDDSWVPISDEYYLIDSFKELSPAELHHLQSADNFSEVLQLLHGAYVQYRSLRAHAFSKKEARSRTGLKDDLLFRLAKLNYKMHRAA